MPPDDNHMQRPQPMPYTGTQQLRQATHLLPAMCTMGCTRQNVDASLVYISTLRGRHAACHIQRHTPAKVHTALSLYAHSCV